MPNASAWPAAGQQRADMPAAESLRDARPVSYWLDQPGAPAPRPALRGPATADLAMVGGGFTGLWTALLAKERDPARDVLLLEGRRIGWAASGRNGGFCSASLTHGLANGLDRFGAEMPTLDRLGRQNLAEIADTVARYSIDCAFERTGELMVATADWQLPGLAGAAAAARGLGGDPVLLDTAAVRAEIDSPTYVAGLWDRDGCAHAGPGPAGLGAAPRLPGRRGADPRALAGHRDQPGGQRAAAGYPAGQRAGGPGRAGHRRVPAIAAAPAQAVAGAGVRLRADDRAAVGRAAGQRRLAAPAGRRGPGQPVPLLPADRGQPDPVGRLRRGLLQRRPDHRRAGPAARHLQRGWPASSSRRSRSWPGCGSVTRGVG